MSDTGDHQPETPRSPLTYLRFAAVMTTVLVSAATILTINEGRRILVLAVFVAAAGLVLLSFTPLGRTRAWQYGFAALVALAAVAGCLWWLAAGSGPEPVAAPARTLTLTVAPTPSPAATPTATLLVALGSPGSGDEVGHCILFRGTFSELPDDQEIVAGIIEPDNDLWYLDRGMQRRGERGWQLHGQFGDGSDRRSRIQEIVVGVIPKAAADALTRVNRNPPDVVPYWFTPGPPPGLHVVARIPVRMTPAAGDCS